MQHAQNVVSFFDTVLVNQRSIACDGGNGALGHPRVFLNLGSGGSVVCPYCSRQYVLDPTKPEVSNH
ncbi:MAG: zinc-finger domain-containing protein [Holosporales bacterium]|jgi:uncharacterized Zn-finger protein